VDILIPFLIFAAVALAVYTLASPQDDTVRSRLRSVVADVLPRSVQLQQPFTYRVILPAITRLAALVGRYTPVQVVEQTRRQLVMAGLWRADPLIFITLRFLIGAGLLGLVVLSEVSLRLRVVPAAPIAAAAGLLGYYLPVSWLRGRIKARQDRIARQLPDTLDLLTVCVEAGLGLDQGLQKVVERGSGPLHDEIRRYLEEIRLGKDREEALRHVAARSGVQDLQSFVTTLVQAIHLGVSIADVLRTQAEFARTMRRQRIEEHAMKAPIKVLFPIIMFIFPAIFVALAGPAAIQLFTYFFRR
jgi:tight adherence protein C